MAAGFVYWIAEDKLQRLSEAFQLFKNHNGWKDDIQASTYLTFGCQSYNFTKNHIFKKVKWQSSTEFIINLYREHSTKKPFCDSIFNLKEQLVALQLIMAQLNKEETGEFAVKMHDVLEAHEEIMKYKLSMDEEENSISKLCTAYNKFLLHCNSVDFADVFQRVKTCFIMDSNVKDMLQISQQFVVTGKPKTQLEQQILQLMVGNRTLICFTETEDGQHSLSEKTADMLLHREVPADVLGDQLLNISPQRRTPSPALSHSVSQESLAQDQLLKVCLSYLRLLVNSRDELALSQAINIPHRDLAHKQFTVLRKVAREKNMPMFQTAVSFILRIRLGGKSYAPSNDNPLLPLTKGLGEFVTFFQKLQNVCEEIADAKNAVLRIINMLKVSIIKSKEKVFTNECIAKTVESLKEKVEQLSCKTGDGDETKSSMAGMNVYFLIQAVLDEHVKQSCLQEYETMDLRCALMTPELPHGKSKIQSTLSQFRTPDSESSEAAVTPPKDQPTKHKPEKKPFESYRKVCGDMSWAKPAYSIQIGPSPANKRDQMMTAAVNTDILTSRQENGNESYIKDTPKCHTKKRTLTESIYDKENIPIGNKTINDVKKPPAKRMLLETDITAKKSSKGKTKTKTLPKRKKIPLLQGQKQLTNFFR